MAYELQQHLFMSSTYCYSFIHLPWINDNKNYLADS